MRARALTTPTTDTRVALRESEKTHQFVDHCLLLIVRGTKMIMNSSVYFLCVMFCTVVYHCNRSSAVELSQSLLDAIRYVESRGDVCALGDSGESLGAYQIMHEYYRYAVEANETLTANGEGMIYM